MKPDAELALFKSLAVIKGKLDGLVGEFPCDLSGSKPGCATGTDIIDYIQDDLNHFRSVTDVVVPEELRAEVLKAYADSYNKVASKERYG